MAQNTGLVPARSAVRPSGRELAAVVAAAGGFALVYLLIARSQGALGIARNDDWSFLRVAFDFSRTGHIQLTNWGQMTLVGQVLLAAPVLAVAGRSIVVLQVMVAVLGAVAVVLSYLLLRTFLSARWSALSCAVLLVGPVFGSLSASFMTDVPAYFVETLTLLLGWRALSRDRISIGWLTLSAVAGVIAVSIRDTGALAFGAVLLVALARAYSAGDGRRLRAAAIVGLGFAVVAVALLVWAHGLPHAEPTSFALRPTAARKVPRAAMTLALFISPCVLVVSPRRLLATVSRAPIRLKVIFGVLYLAIVGASTANFIGDYFSARVSLQSSRDPSGVSIPIVIPRLVYLGLRVLAVYVLAVVMGLLLEAVEVGLAQWKEVGWRGVPALVAAPASAAPLLTVFVFGSGLAQALGMLVLDIPFYDRYLIGVIPFAAGLVLVFAQSRGMMVVRGRRGLAAAGLVGLALVGLLVVDASAANDGAKWALSEKAVTMGYQPGTIDGSFEWFAFHQPDAVSVQPKRRHHPWWTLLFTPRPICVTVGTAARRGPLSASSALATERATTVFDQHFVFVLRPGPDRCPTPTP